MLIIMLDIKILFYGKRWGIAYIKDIENKYRVATYDINNYCISWLKRIILIRYTY